MTLKELNISPYQKIRICTKNGSNFIYIGLAGELDFEQLNKQTRMRCIASATEAIFDYDPKKPKVLDRAIERFKQWMPVEDREVIEQYPGQLEYSTVIQITGSEGWIPYDPKVRPLKPEEVDQQGAEILVSQIYKGLCIELIHAYQTDSKDLITKAEKEIRMNKFGLFDDAEAIIYGCRKKAGIAN